MNGWSDYVIEGRRSNVLSYRGEILHYGDYVIIYGGKCGGSTNPRIASGILTESDRNYQVALKRLGSGEINYVGFNEIDSIIVEARSVDRLPYTDNSVFAASGNRLGVLFAGRFFTKDSNVIVYLQHTLLIGKILSIDPMGIKLEKYNWVPFSEICRIAPSPSPSLKHEPKLAKDCTPTELREIADLKEHIEYQKVKIAKLEEDAKVASFKINHQANTIKDKDSQIYNLYAANQKLKEGFWKEEARAKRAYDLIESMPKVIVNHYKNKLAKQGY